jgi:DNA-binding transcriptional ArsR family regulator
MVRYRLAQDDLLRTRFAISPLFEVCASVAALRDPASSSLHLPWVRAARERLRGVAYPTLDALVSSTGYSPDFVAQPPATPLPDVHAEIRRVARTPPEQVRREVRLMLDGRRPTAVLRGLLDDPAAGLRTLAAELSAYWAAAMAPVWDRVRAVLEDDIAHRARLLTAGGAIEMLGDLHPDVRYAGGEVCVDRPVDAVVQLGGRGLQLVPCAFVWPSVAAMYDPPWQPAVIYPPRGIGLLWEPPAPRDDGALAELLGARRAAILAALDREASTTVLARRLAASPAGVSEHLGVLRRAGLVRGRRVGREVRYLRTAAGDALLRGVPS